MSMAVGAESLDSEMHTDAFLTMDSYGLKGFSLKGHLGLHSFRNQRCI